MLPSGWFVFVCRRNHQRDGRDGRTIEGESEICQDGRTNEEEGTARGAAQAFGLGCVALSGIDTSLNPTEFLYRVDPLSA